MIEKRNFETFEQNIGFKLKEIEVRGDISTLLNMTVVCKFLTLNF